MNVYREIAQHYIGLSEQAVYVNHSSAHSKATSTPPYTEAISSEITPSQPTLQPDNERVQYVIVRVAENQPDNPPHTCRVIVFHKKKTSKKTRIIQVIVKLIMIIIFVVVYVTIRKETDCLLLFHLFFLLLLLLLCQTMSSQSCISILFNLFLCDIILYS